MVFIDKRSGFQKLKSLKQNVNWEIEIERRDLLDKLYSLFTRWQGCQLPNLLDIFLPKNIDLILTDSVQYMWNGYEGIEIIRFVAQTGYKDRPKVEQDGNPSSRRTTAVHRAFTTRYEIVSLLFKIYDNFDVNYTDDSGLTHFHVACKFGCEDVVEKFLERGQDPNCLVPYTGNTPLIYAVSWGREQIARLLLKHGGNPNIANKDGSTPLHVICERIVKDDDFMEIFFEIIKGVNHTVQVDARNRYGDAPLHLAVRESNAKAIESLLRNGADPSLALHLICLRRDNDDLVRLFFRISDEVDKPLQLNALDKLGRTPLHIAVADGCKKQIVRELLARGADPNTADKEGSTPLHCTCKKGRGDATAEIFLEITDEFTQAVQIDAQDGFGNTPLHLALKYSRMDVAWMLLGRGASSASVNQMRATPLHIICESFYLNRNYRAEQLEIVQELMRRDANWYSANTEGSTPLHVVCNRCSDYDDLASTLLREISDRHPPVHQSVIINNQDNEGNSPLHLALSRGHANLAVSLLTSGANPNLANDSGRTPLHVVCNRPDRDLARIFLNASEAVNPALQVNVQDRLGNTPLHLAAECGNARAIETLLIRGARPNLANRHGLTTLHVICKRDHDDETLLMKFVQEIIKNERGPVQIDARDNLGETPLHVAVSLGHKKLINLLLRYGADPNSTNVVGSTPLHIICKRQHDYDDVIEVFFNVNKYRNQLVLVDTVDNLGRTPLQWAVANLFPHAVHELLIRGADLSIFVFPDESYFAERLESRYNGISPNFKLKLAASALIIVELLEKKGYELDRSDALTIMRFFAKLEMSELFADLDERWYDNEEFTEWAKNLKMGENPSLYDLIRLRPKEAAKQFWNYYNLAQRGLLQRCPRGQRQACLVHLYEIMSRKFFQDWAMDCFSELINYRFPVPCCEMIIEELTNKDLYNICLAATT
ncbi:serine/threonine-protein phosphatase 6 regulatory ankyrin repeat subunit C-like [Trichogramma pretiosum]|uniref:serine/threonine-protein phosphatase 6 regulatory ankyrin repeat subunit C-like n=1 Tax=Trichogramma pretiosum TaxID=7493 RepID=UPI000C71BEFF|nr:serine/threonine-protein phosphatase 6 regulatory ankyrin repeat subunit C-like [Trichogramma pretiosum]